jgi:hypothetical protein
LLAAILNATLSCHKRCTVRKNVDALDLAMGMSRIWLNGIICESTVCCLVLRMLAHYIVQTETSSGNHTFNIQAFKPPGVARPVSDMAAVLNKLNAIEKELKHSKQAAEQHER